VSLKVSVKRIQELEDHLLELMKGLAEARLTTSSKKRASGEVISLRNAT
jgi:hypothetical protein